MDTSTDFLFLNERISTNFNPFYEGEYLVIQTYPREIGLRVSKRDFDYQSAKNYCEVENLAHDYTSFGVRVFHEQKLWDIDFCGHPSNISKQQDWKISPEYLSAHSDSETNEEIIVCSCSYPRFEEFANDFWKLTTCLVDDKGRDVEYCPNCNAKLMPEEDWGEDFDFYDEEPRPAACIGCDNYHGQKYGENLLVCGIYPHGYQGEICPDFQDKVKIKD
ncbi:hypothetical protein NIES4072_71240 [Nostoc commune NIES-4072]|uniref:Uncharacterized protein n=1 Tax=Nostoc commune NIES-4072 TaxID=2005467 RepID=A0A2R5FXC5_NOSCO|nr:hypothetical protein [Nostoc commune]BBD70758.1 hypothetical protein NIES4070_71690 [Nostoc commune HK-02]GBG23412.1 hypothetical protein NIES4072_71240 [Nostoc commune NIES-4072]